MRIYAEEIENNGFHKTYVWDKDLLREILINKMEEDSEEKINEVIASIESGNEVVLGEGNISKFRIASPTEIEAALAYEADRLKELDAHGGDASDITNQLEKLFASQFVD